MHYLILRENSDPVRREERPTAAKKFLNKRSALVNRLLYPDSVIVPYWLYINALKNQTGYIYLNKGQGKIIGFFTNN